MNRTHYVWVLQYQWIKSIMFGFEPFFFYNFMLADFNNLFNQLSILITKLALNKPAYRMASSYSSMETQSILEIWYPSSPCALHHKLLMPNGIISFVRLFSAQKIGFLNPRISQSIFNMQEGIVLILNQFVLDVMECWSHINCKPSKLGICYFQN